MTLARLSIRDLRCLAQVDIEPDAALNLFSGPNASGKTSLLEAVYLLGRGRSFRSARRQAAIREGAERAQVIGRLGDGRTIGIELRRSGWTARAGGSPVESLVELASLLPVQLLDPDIHRLVQEGPGERRRFLDWATFHVKPGFLEVWRTYHRAMRQRNAALREGQSLSMLRPWEEAMAEAGQVIDRLRAETAALLQPPISAAAAALLDGELELAYRPGQAAGVALAEALATSRDRDRRAGLTHVGPHRADLSVVYDRHRARGWVSRGQQKLVAAALVLGQSELLAPAWGGRGILLVDDPAAELDPGRAGRLLARVAALPFQVFVTALDPAPLAGLAQGRRFHVEQGEIRPVV